MKKFNAKELKRKHVLAVLLSAAMLLGLAACGSGAYDSVKNEMAFAPAYDSAGATNGAFGGAYDEGYYMDTEMPAENAVVKPEAAVDNSAYFNNRKLIRTVNLDVETKEFDQMVATVENQVTALGGYIESMNTYNGSRYYYSGSSKNANITARIPKQQLNVFLDTVSEIGNVTRRSENVEDVTLAYVDMESRKEALKVEQERLMELLKMADNLEDMLIIEERMTSVRYQLESMESQLRTYDNKVDFATVYLSISEVKELTPVEEETVWQRITGGLKESLEDVADGLVDFVVWFIVSIPYLVIWAVVITVIVLIVRLCIRHHRKKKARKQEQMQQAYGQERQIQDQGQQIQDRNQQIQDQGQ